MMIAGNNQGSKQNLNNTQISNGKLFLVNDCLETKC